MCADVKFTKRYLGQKLKIRPCSRVDFPSQAGEKLLQSHTKGLDALDLTCVQPNKGIE